MRIPWRSFFLCWLTGVALAACASAPAKPPTPTPTPEQPEPTPIAPAADPKPEPHDLFPVSYLPVLHASYDEGATAYVVVPDVGEPRAGIGRGAPKLLRREGIVFVVRAVDPTKLSETDRAWLGLRLVTNGECEGHIERLAQVLRFEPDFDAVRRWEGENDSPRRLSDDEIAAEAWRDYGSSRHVLLAGELGTCLGEWARTPDRPPPWDFAPAAVEPALEQALVAKLRKLPGWKSIQEYAKAAGVTSKTWDTWQDARPIVRAWSGGGRTFAQVTAEAGESCGDEFHGAFGALFEVKGEGAKAQLELLTDPEDGAIAPVVEVIDIDADGVVEFLLEDGVIWRDGRTWRRTHDVSPPSYDNPC